MTTRRRAIRVLIPMILAAMLVTACSTGTKAKSKYTYEFLGSFDTLIQIVGYSDNETSFGKYAKQAQARFESLNRLYDIYHSYDGLNNVRTINERAGITPVKVDKDLLELIRFSKEWHDKTAGVCNIAMGPVLSLWHDARTAGIDDPANAMLPDMAKLKAASLLCNLDDVVVDETAGTVFLKKAGMSLDVGAVAKGYACGIVANELKASGLDSFIVSGGGNILAAGAPKDGVRTKWGVGIQNPDGDVLNPDEDPLDVAYVNDMAVVTSGDYQRNYVVDGKSYHHLIDPQTLMPAAYYRAVTVMVPDSGIADFFSTTLFLLPYEESLAAAKAAGVDAIWILPDGTRKTTDGMEAVLRDMGGAVNR